MTSPVLKGVRVLEWADGLSGPYCTRLLADLGATVIKIEQPGAGDPVRQHGPFWPDEPYGADSALFGWLNGGKRSITLDPTKASGADLLRHLAAESDLLVESRLSEAEGLTVGSLFAQSPQLVVLSITPFGRTGRCAGWAASDLVVQHMAGYAYHQATPVDQPAETPPIGCADREGPLAVGLTGAVAAMWGLIAVRSGRKGFQINLSARDFFAHLLVEQIATWSKGEREFDRKTKEFKGAEVAGGLIWSLQCSDGWVMASPREQHQWERWMEILGNPTWSHDAKLCGDRLPRKQNWLRLQQFMSEWTVHHTTAEVFALAQQARVPCFPISTAADLIDNCQLIDRRFFHQLQAPSGRTVPAPGIPFRMLTTGGSRIGDGQVLRAPAVGEDNEAVFSTMLGLPASVVEELRSTGVV